jgi:hypothetical protein
MTTIYYNSYVARICGNNGIIKAVLINYIYNFHKTNLRKGVGYPAKITLAEFVYQYTSGEKSLWQRSFIHRMLTDLCKDGHLLKTHEDGVAIYSVSNEICELLNEKDTKLVSFKLSTACDYGIHIAIVAQYLRYVITKSPEGVAYNLDVNDMSEVNRLSPAQIYRAIKYLIEGKVFMKVKLPPGKRSRSLSLALGQS